MILPLKYYKEYGWMRTTKLVLSGMSRQLFGLGLSKRRRKQALANEMTIPRLKVKGDENGSTFCVSCGLCSKICPTQAITVEADTSIQFPKGLKTGPAPRVFEISDDLCLRCSLCVEVCPVDALSPCAP